MFIVTLTHVIGRVFHPFHVDVTFHDEVWPILVPFFMNRPYVTLGVLELYCCR